MTPAFRVVTPRGEWRAETTGENPDTARALLRELPLVGEAQRWGEEVYFYVDVELPPEQPREVVEVGDVGYWPQGPAVALFFGRTPASTDDRPRAASGVNVFARIAGDLTGLNAVRPGDRVALHPL